MVVCHDENGGVEKHRLMLKNTVFVSFCFFFLALTRKSLLRPTNNQFLSERFSKILGTGMHFGTVCSTGIRTTWTSFGSRDAGYDLRAHFVFERRRKSTTWHYMCIG
jgi:hypothetical protein